MTYPIFIKSDFKFIVAIKTNDAPKLSTKTNSNGDSR